MFKLNTIRKNASKDDEVSKDSLKESLDSLKGCKEGENVDECDADLQQNGFINEKEHETFPKEIEEIAISHNTSHKSDSPMKSSLFPLKSIKKKLPDIESNSNESSNNHINERSQNSADLDDVISKTAVGENIEDQPGCTHNSASSEFQPKDKSSVNDDLNENKDSSLLDYVDDSSITNGKDHLMPDDNHETMETGSDTEIKSNNSVDEGVPDEHSIYEFQAFILSDEYLPNETIEYLPTLNGAQVKYLPNYSLNEIIETWDQTVIDIAPCDVIIIQLGLKDVFLKYDKDKILNSFEKIINLITLSSQTIKILISVIIPRPNIHHLRLISLRMIDCGLKRIFASSKYKHLADRIFFISDINKINPFSMSNADLISHFEIDNSNSEKVPSLNESGYTTLQKSLVLSLNWIWEHWKKEKSSKRKLESDSDERPSKVCKFNDTDDIKSTENAKSTKGDITHLINIDQIKDAPSDDSQHTNKMDVDLVETESILKNSNAHDNELDSEGKKTNEDNSDISDKTLSPTIKDFDTRAKLCMIEFDVSDIFEFKIETIGRGLHYIWNVQRDSHAYFAYLRKYDRIVEINKVNTENLSHEEVFELIRSSKTPLELIVVNKKADKFLKSKRIQIGNEMKELINVKSEDKTVFDADVNENDLDIDIENNENADPKPGTCALIITDEKLEAESMEFVPGYSAEIKCLHNKSLKQLYSSLISDEFDLSMYSLILIQFGILDLYQKQAKDEIVDDFEKLLTTIHTRAPSLHIVISSLIPRPKIHCLRLIALRVIDCALKRLFQEKCKIIPLIKKIFFVSDMKNTKPFAFSNAVLGDYFESSSDDKSLPALNEKGMETCQNSLSDYLKWAWNRILEMKANKRRNDICSYINEEDKSVVKPVPLIESFDETSIPLEIRDEIKGKESGVHGYLKECLPDWIEDADVKSINQFIPDTVDKVIALELQELNLNKKMTIQSTIKVGNYIIQKGYSNEELMKKSSTDFVDFNELGTRIAYLIRYFPTHAYAIKHHLSNALGIIELPGGDSIFKDHRVMNDWVNKQKDNNVIKVACFGGGPGSDVLGILDFLNEVSTGFTIQLAMFDKFIYWEKTLRKMIDVLVKNGVDIKLKFVEVDFLKIDDIMSVIEYVRHAHIITMSKFISAIRAYESETKQGLKAVYENMAPGSLIFFMDNKGGGSYQLFNTVANECDMWPVYSFIHGYPMPDGALNHFKKYRNEYGMRPASILTIAVMMYAKPPLETESLFDYTPSRRIVPRMNFDHWDMDFLYQDPGEIIPYESLFYR